MIKTDERREGGVQTLRGTEKRALTIVRFSPRTAPRTMSASAINVELR